jgi:hypothetical protein
LQTEIDKEEEGWVFWAFLLLVLVGRDAGKGRVYLWFCLAVFLQKRKRWAVCCNGQNRKIEGRKGAGNRDKRCRKIKDTKRVLRA